MVKFIIILYFSYNGYKPIPIIFDTYKACNEVELSIKRLSNKASKITPRQMYFRGHIDTPYFISCRVHIK